MEKRKKIINRPFKSKVTSRIHPENQPPLRRRAVLAQVKQINEETGEDQYSVPTFLRLYTGYDFLENLVYIIPYLKLKYDLKNHAYVFTLLNLYPKNIFSLKDYQNIKFIRFSMLKIKKFEDLGFARCIYNHHVEGKKLYQLTKKGRDLVEETYKLLAGEIEMDLSIFDKKDFAINKKYKKHIKLHNDSHPNRENRKAFWTRKKQDK